MCRTPLRRAVKALLAVPCLALAGSLAAQDTPPLFLQIFREEVKVGRNAHHLQNEIAWGNAYRKANIGNYIIGLTPMYGPPEAWFLNGVGSLADVEKLNAKIAAVPGLEQEINKYAEADAEDVSAARGMLARYRPDLSNDPDQDVAQMRLFEAIIFRVRPGHESSFADGAKLYRDVVQRATVKSPWATYEVMAGMPGPVFIVFALHKTLAEIDPANTVGQAIQKAMNEETAKKFSALAEGYQSIETIIFSVSSEMSYPPPEFVERDPKFWGKKPSVPATAQPSRRPRPAN